MTDHSELLHGLSNGLGVPLPESEVETAHRVVDKVFDDNTEEMTLSILTVKIIRALLPLYRLAIVYGGEDERWLVNELQPFVAHYMDDMNFYNVQ